MIDIHTHLMPGVDDGVKTVEEALECLKAMEENGVEAVFLTPHVAKKRRYYKLDVFHERFALIQEALKAEKRSINVYLGSEIDESDGLFEDIEKAPSMNGTNVYMIDYGMREANIEESIYECLVRGVHVIVAHPERLDYLDFKRLKAIKAEGALFQVSAPHLIKMGDRRAQKMARKLLKEDLIDFVASDTHSSHNRMDIMAKAYRYVKKKKGADVAHKIFYMNAKALMCDYRD